MPPAAGGRALRDPSMICGRASGSAATVVLAPLLLIARHLGSFWVTTPPFHLPRLSSKISSLQYFSFSACSFGLSTISQQYFSLRTNQPRAIS
jgi:hypothetical protein